MAFDEKLAARARTHLGKRPGLVEKKMFGGIAFLLLRATYLLIVVGLGTKTSCKSGWRVDNR